MPESGRRTRIFHNQDNFRVSWKLFMIMVACIFVAATPPVVADGKELFSSGNVSGALTAFTDELATTQGAAQAPVLNNIGTCYLALGQPEKAIDYFSHAISVDPGYGLAYLNLGIVQEQGGRADDALATYDHGASAVPSIRPLMMVKKGTLLSSLGKLDEALAAFHNGEDGANGTVAADLYTGIGAIEFIQKKTDKAEKDFLRAIDADPNGAALAWTNLGVLKIAQNKKEEAITTFKNATIRDPNGTTQAAQYLKKITNQKEISS